jgi:hypothetical protein
MIWFTCSSCSKTHGRPESSGGTLIFCTCGQGVRVPWESTAAAPANLPPAAAAAPPPPPPAPAPPRATPSDMPAGPRLEPVTFDSTPPPRAAQPAELDRRDSDRRDSDRRDSGPRRRPGKFRIDPNYCLNHTNTPSKTPCADCHEAFCGDCLLTFQGETLCGPCKNFRIRMLDSAPRVSMMAMISVLVALGTGPLALCILPMSRSWGAFFGLVALVPQVVAIVLALIGLREVEQNPKVGGWSLAFTGLMTAGVSCVLTVVVTVFGPRLGV